MPDAFSHSNKTQILRATVCSAPAQYSASAQWLLGSCSPPGFNCNETTEYDSTTMSSYFSFYSCFVFDCVELVTVCNWFVSLPSCLGCLLHHFVSFCIHWLLMSSKDQRHYNTLVPEILGPTYIQPLHRQQENAIQIEPNRSSLYYFCQSTSF